MNNRKLLEHMENKTGFTRQFAFHSRDSVGVYENSRTLHWHKEVEICRIRQGTGKYIINGHVYPFSTGDVFIINNDEIHLAYDDKDLIMQVIMFDPSILWAGGYFVMDCEYLLPFTEAGMKYGNMLHHQHEHIEAVLEVLDDIQQEFEARELKYELMIKSLLLKLMTIIMRYFGKDEEKLFEDKLSQPDSRKLKLIIEYMEENYSRQIRLDDMAKAFEMSVSKFCSLFRSFSGIPPMEYIIRRRVSAAKLLLTSTDKKILAISEECGFNSISSFNKSFKLHTGFSPKEYRSI